MSKIKLGCDPEFYLIDRETGHPVSAHNIVDGDKKNPAPLPSGGTVQRDGVAVEFNTPVSTSAKEFADNVNAALNDLRKMIPQKYQFRFMPFTNFNKEYFTSLPDTVKELGCDPDMNAYTGTYNRSPGKEAQDSPSRAFGGHIHIGWGKDLGGESHVKDCCLFIKQLESLGIPDYAHAIATYESQVRRSALYGARGAFRPKSYGVEWRAPSNVWLQFGPRNWETIFTMAEAVFINMTEGRKRTIPAYHIPSRSISEYTK